jgi:hypothetical protein
MLQNKYLLYVHQVPASSISIIEKKFGIKDIVQPKKRGDERGTIRTVLTSYTIADIF